MGDMSYASYAKNSILVFLVLGLLMAGCINVNVLEKLPQITETPPSQPSTETPVIKRPSFEILSPVENGVIKTLTESANVEVVIGASDLIIKAPGGTKKVGEGHFELSLDGKGALTTNTKHIFENVAIGEHTLKVEIKQNDYSSYVPKIIKTIKFKVEKDIEALAPKEHIVSIRGLAFEPAEITIKVGDKVTWVNDDKMPHTATSSGNFDTSGIPSGSSSKTITFDKEGTFEYRCTLYPSAKGKVIVKSK